ncbi:hypothetical protein DFH09DRAFT_1136806 [Mycena vulgaris]|nr:hypothetical protein DFH09DRAFT_1136806 [Mycena vulgaris]
MTCSYTPSIHSTSSVKDHLIASTMPRVVHIFILDGGHAGREIGLGGGIAVGAAAYRPARGDPLRLELKTHGALGPCRPCIPGDAQRVAEQLPAETFQLSAVVRFALRSCDPDILERSPLVLEKNFLESAFIAAGQGACMVSRDGLVPRGKL